MPPKRNFRKPPLEEEEEDDQSKLASSEEEEKRRLAFEEVMYFQKLRERKLGISGTGKSKPAKKAEPEGEKEDPNMVKYIEQELAKKRGKSLEDAEEVVNELKRLQDDLYKTPDHLKVWKHSSEERSTQLTHGIAEVQLPIEYKLKNIEETEAAKKLLREKMLIGCPESEFKKEFFEEKYGKGWVMVKKMGYDVLKGLGRNCQGIKYPIEALEIRPINQGLGYCGYSEEDLKTEAVRFVAKSEAYEAKPEVKKKAALVPYSSDEEDEQSRVQKKKS